MKRTPSKPGRPGIRDHYDFDYSKSRPNRFASSVAEAGTIAVVLEPDVAKVFDSAEAVNTREGLKK